MRVCLAVLIGLFVSSAFDTVRADPYRWCADLSIGEGDSATNCGFQTWEQCRAAVSGIGGVCRLNNFYDGRPFDTPTVAQQRTKNKEPIRRD